MENYFKDFKSERTHDYKLIEIVKLLAENGKQEIFRETLLGKDFPNLGNFINGTTKRDFDVWLEFENYNVIIETKKAGGEIPNIEAVKQFVKNNSDNLKIENINSTLEDYWQGAYVLYEWDLHLLKTDISTNINSIEKVLLNAISVLQ